MIRFASASLVLALAVAGFVGCEKKITAPTATITATEPGKSQTMTLPPPPTSPAPSK